MVPTCKYKQLFWTVLNCHSSTNFITKQHFFSDLTKSHTDLTNQIVSYQNQIETIKRDLEAAQADLAAKNLSFETASVNLEAKDRVIADLSDQCNGHELSIEKLQSTVKSVSQVSHSELFLITSFKKLQISGIKVRLSQKQFVLPSILPKKATINDCIVSNASAIF